MEHCTCVSGAPVNAGSSAVLLNNKTQLKEHHISNSAVAMTTKIVQTPFSNLFL